MKTLIYNLVNLDVKSLCKNIETNIDIKLGNIDVDNPPMTNGFMTYGTGILTIYFYENADVQLLNNSFFVVDSDLNNMISAVDNYIKSNF